MASFLSLPAEIRAEIYELYLHCLARDGEVTCDLDVPSWSSIATDRRFLPQLCHVSRRVRAEFLPLWASHLTITIPLEAVQYRSDQQYVLTFLDAFGGSLVRGCKELNLPFCKILLAGKRSVDEDAAESARGNTFFVLVRREFQEDANVRLLSAKLKGRLRTLIDRDEGLGGDEVKEVTFGPLRMIGRSFVKWECQQQKSDLWTPGSCLRSRMRGL